MRRDDTVFAALTYWMGIIVGVRRSDIQDRYRFDTGIFCWIGVSVWRDWSKFDILHSYYCAIIVKPHKSHKHIVKKYHKVFVHYTSSVKTLHSLMSGTDEYLSQVHIKTSLRCSCPSSSIQLSNCVPYSVTRVKTIKLSPLFLLYLICK